MKDLDQTIEEIATNFAHQAHTAYLNGVSNQWQDVHGGTAAEVLSIVYEVQFNDIHKKVWKLTEEKYQRLVANRE